MPEQEQHPLILSGEHLIKINRLVDQTSTRRDISAGIKRAETFARIATRGLARARALGKEENEKENRLSLVYHTELIKLLRAKLVQFRRERR